MKWAKLLLSMCTLTFMYIWKIQNPIFRRKQTSVGDHFKSIRRIKKSIEVRDVVSSFSARSWKKMTLRDTTRGALKVRICRFDSLCVGRKIGESQMLDFDRYQIPGGQWGYKDFSEQCFGKEQHFAVWELDAAPTILG